MIQYREIFRLTAMGLMQRSILESVKCSQKNCGGGGESAAQSTRIEVVLAAG